MKTKLHNKVIAIVIAFTFTIVCVQCIKTDELVGEINVDNLATTYDYTYTVFDGPKGEPTACYFYRWDTQKEQTYSGSEYYFIDAYQGPTAMRNEYTMETGETFSESFSAGDKGSAASITFGHSRDTKTSVKKIFDFPGDQEKWYLYQVVTKALYDFETDEAIYHKDVTGYDSLNIFGKPIVFYNISYEPEWQLDSYDYYSVVGHSTEYQYSTEITQDVH